MKKCPNCNKEFDDNKVFCENCGTKLTEVEQIKVEETTVEETTSESGEVICPKCHSKNKKGSKFCETCGIKLTEKYVPELTDEEKIERTKKRVRMTKNIFLLIIGSLLLIGVLSEFAIDGWDNNISLFTFFSKEYFQMFSTINTTYYREYAFMRELLHLFPFLVALGGVTCTIVFGVKGIVITAKNMLNKNEKVSVNCIGFAAISYLAMCYILKISFTTSSYFGLHEMPSFILFLCFVFSVIASALDLSLVGKDKQRGRVVTSFILRIFAFLFGLSALGSTGESIFKIRDNYSEIIRFSTLPEFLISNNNSGTNYAFAVLLVIFASIVIVFSCISIYVIINKMCQKSKSKVIYFLAINLCLVILLYVMTNIFISPIIDNNVVYTGQLVEMLTSTIIAFGFGISGILLQLEKKE